jgi:hypothetical protein
MKLATVAARLRVVQVGPLWHVDGVGWLMSPWLSARDTAHLPWCYLRCTTDEMHAMSHPVRLTWADGCDAVILLYNTNCKGRTAKGYAGHLLLH